eukprot:CAMPEP_0115571886 /NCGR_PEP_ID=MMETSP0272-20121206/185_1 /TAXON_ID=71861 /ORGANISM="Scrippsiella trochoidea, Strain CCMP3099" /LENGTH=91 /DNA_ID=CAMNT_0003006475 /DNA_START=770 /DNA_END=1047 /DNA_ORIENTATION=+
MANKDSEASAQLEEHVDNYEAMPTPAGLNDDHHGMEKLKISVWCGCVLEATPPSNARSKGNLQRYDAQEWCESKACHGQDKPIICHIESGQ